MVQPQLLTVCGHIQQTDNSTVMIFIIVPSSHLYSLGQRNWIGETDGECKGIYVGEIEKFVENIIGKLERKARLWDEVRRTGWETAACRNVERFRCLAIESDGRFLWAQHESSCCIQLFYGLVSCSLIWGLHFRRDAERRDALYLPSLCSCRRFPPYTVFLEEVFFPVCLREIINTSFLDDMSWQCDVRVCLKCLRWFSLVAPGSG